MSSQNPQYYRPYYPSDSEEDSEIVSLSPSGTPTGDSGVSTPDGSIAQGPANFAEFAYKLQQGLAAGPTFSTLQQDISYATNRISKTTTYGPYEPPAADESTTQVKPPEKQRTTLLMLQSRDRDRSIYPQPTSCSLTLPRLYTNIKQFQIAQLSLLSAFYYFRADKANLLIQIEEQNRQVYPKSNQAQRNPSTGSLIENIINTTIRQGTYSINELVAELSRRLNTPPVFYDYPNGIIDFNPLFQINGDFSLNFNYPGDYFYDSLKQVYISNLTRAAIAQFYFQSTNAPPRTIYTYSQVRNAYYYPVIRELVLDTPSLLSLTPDQINHIIYGFTGINDTILSSILISDDVISILDTYRVEHTFRYGLVNQYSVTYESNTNRINITATSLNNSLVNLLTNKYNLYKNQQILLNGLTPDQYATLQTQIQMKTTVFQDMYKFLEVQLASYFGISRGTYSKEYYTNFDLNHFLIQDGFNLKQGVGGVFSQNQVSTDSISTNILQGDTVTQPLFWPGLFDLPLPIQTVPTNMGDATNDVTFPATSNFPYSIGSGNIQLNTYAINSEGGIAIGHRRRCMDLIANVDPMKYTIFKVKSKIRQTLQVEVFPRPTQYRVPEYVSSRESIYPPAYPTAELFTRNYTFVTPSDPEIQEKLLNKAILNEIPGFETRINPTSLTTGGISFLSSFSTISASPILMNISQCNAFYSFQTPYPFSTPTEETATSTFRYSLNVTFLTSTTTTGSNSDLVAFLYHDYGAFMADVTSNRYENPLHYITSTTILTSEGEGPLFSTTLSFVAYAADTYYLNVRFLTTSPNSINFYAVPWYTDETYTQLLTTLTDFDPYQDPAQNLSSLYCARIADPAYLKLPIASTLWGNDPTSDPLYPTAESAAPPIGYDSSNVSNDLTDYVPFNSFNNRSTINPDAIIRCDPTNNYFFRTLSPYNTNPTVQSYFYQDSKNTIISPGLQKNYSPQAKTTPRDYKIVHWYGTHTVAGSHTEGVFTSPTISPNYQPYSIATTGGVPLNLYKYENTKQTLALGEGVCGFTFLPSDGIWSVERVTFKSSYIAAPDPNASIQFLGIFPTSQISDKPLKSINLTDAMTKLTLQKTTVYSREDRLNQGFDAQLGTYYTYAVDTTFITTNAAIMSGYTQNGKYFLADIDSHYSVIPFSDISTVATFYQLVGSAVPYPYACQATSQLMFYGLESPSAYGVVVPSPIPGADPKFGPPPGYDETLSVYEQSIPHGTSVLHYKISQDFMKNPNAFAPWRLTSIPHPVSICASMKGYAVLQDTSIAIVKFPFNTVHPNNKTIIDDREFKYVTSFTPDMLYPAGDKGSFLVYQGTGYIGCAGNDSNFFFYGAEMVAPGNTYQLHVKRFDPRPIMASIEQVPIVPTYQIPSKCLITQILATSNNGFFLSAKLNDNSTLVLGTPSYDSPHLFSIQYFPNNDFAEIALDQNGANLYVLTYDSRVSKGASTLLQYPYASFQAGAFPTPIRFNLLRYDSLNNAFPKTYSKVMVTMNESREEVYFITKESPGIYDRYFYKIKNSVRTTVNNTYDSEMEVNKEFTFLDPIDRNVVRPPLQLYSGYGGARWATFSTPPYIQGNRNDSYDSLKSIRNAWQIFYPTMKVQLTRRANTYTPVYDLAGIASPEYPHSMLFAYSSLTSLNSDIYNDTGLTRGKWGQESNFYVSDTQMNGVYFGGYLKRLPMQEYNASLDNTYYIALRGYSPTESFQSMVRFYLPNRYDFGFVTINDIIEETPLLLGHYLKDYKGNITPQPDLFNPSYGELLNIFNKQFIFPTPVLFGSNDTLQFPGYAISSTGFSNFITQYSSFYGSYSALQSNLNNIQNKTTESLTKFTSTNLQYILPSTAFNRERFTDAIPFRILWSTCLTQSYSVLDDEWGLGWNLGYAKQDTPFGTTQLAPTFFKILDEYIYLKLNDTFNLNRLDKGAKEDYKVTREATGVTQTYNSKLLLAPFGNYANVIIQNPITFETPLAKMDKLTFTWTDSLGATINNANCEWTMSIQITESS